jgi:hypothetical protein
MKAIAINPRKSALKAARVHFVNERGAFCRLEARNGWREVPARAVDCPKWLQAHGGGARKARGRVRPRGESLALVNYPIVYYRPENVTARA